MSLHKIYNGDLPDNINIKGDLAIDTETTGLLIPRDRLCLIQMCDSNKNIYLVKFDNDYKKAKNLKKILLNKNIQKIFHFARFDMAMIKHYLKVQMNNVFCTKIASKLVRTYSSYHGLKEICRDLLGVSISKYQQSSYWGKSPLAIDQIEYAISDVIHLHELRHALIAMLEKENRMRVAKKLFDFLPTRVELDLMGYKDIFAHTEPNNNIY